MKTEINKSYREYANEVAKRVAHLLHLPKPVKCARITRRRGHANSSSGFSVPVWIFHRHPAFRDYYIAHEVCHYHPQYPHHGRGFYRNEAEVMESFGWRIVHAERGPYLSEIRSLPDNFTVCDRWGRAV